MKRHEVGRSMIEMLGVLAVIGLLSVAGLWGFSIAMARHKANETIHDVMMRAQNVPLIDNFYTTKEAPHEWTFSDLSANEGRRGTFYTLETKADRSTGYIIRVEISGVHRLVCRRILDLRPPYIDAIYVKETGDEDPYEEESKFTGENGTELCDNDENTIAFYFDDNWERAN